MHIKSYDNNKEIFNPNETLLIGNQTSLHPSLPPELLQLTLSFLDKKDLENTLTVQPPASKPVKLVQSLQHKSEARNLSENQLVSSLGSPSAKKLSSQENFHLPFSQEKFLLINALKEDKFEKAECLINSRINVNLSDEKGLTAIHMAAYKGNLKIVKLLLEYGADINQLTQNQVTPLHATVEAVLTDNNVNKEIIETIIFLIKNNANLNLPNHKGTPPLHTLIRRRHIELAKLFIKNGANPKQLYNNKISPLRIASKIGSIELIACLIDAGVNINQLEKYGRSLLYISSCIRHYERLNY